jgi:peptidoglycan/xylan/chitin deacetylase (PgdA/CDA1 family)
MRAILSFHSIDDSGSVLSMSRDQLSSLIDAIRQSGHRIVALRELLDEPAEARRIAFSFDDGMQSLWQNALPLLRDGDVPATLFLTTSRLGDDNRWPGLPPDAPTMTMMTWSQVGELHASGWSVEAHTANHPDLRKLPDAAIHEEMERGNSAIEEELGTRPEIFAYPYGDFDRRVESIASRVYRYALTTEMGQLPPQIDAPHRIPRIETYYFRSTASHALFGSLPFLAYLSGRSVLRRLCSFR